MIDLLRDRLVSAQERIVWNPSAPSFTATVPEVGFSADVVVRLVERGRGFWRFGAFPDATPVLSPSRADGERLAALISRLARGASHQ